jgi:hypothetical protein
MLIKQVSVFIENRKGRLAQFAKILGDNHIDMLAISIADTTDFGILRAIVNDYEKAYKAISEAGYTVTLTEVMAIGVEDRPGGMNKVLDLLNENDISVEYVYSFCRHVDGNAFVIFRVDDTKKALDVLTKNEVRLLTQSEVTSL